LRTYSNTNMSIVSAALIAIGTYSNNTLNY
jgi:hypothetical protein